MRLTLTGGTRYVFEMLQILATTEPIENVCDERYWIVRANVIARDRSQENRKLVSTSLQEKMESRRN